MNGKMGEPPIFLMTGTYAHAELAARVLGLDDRRWVFLEDVVYMGGIDPDKLKVIVTETALWRRSVMIEVYQYLSSRGINYRYVDIDAKSRRDAQILPR